MAEAGRCGSRLSRSAAQQSQRHAHTHADGYECACSICSSSCSGAAFKGASGGMGERMLPTAPMRLPVAAQGLLLRATHCCLRQPPPQSDIDSWQQPLSPWRVHSHRHSCPSFCWVHTADTWYPQPSSTGKTHTRGGHRGRAAACNLSLAVSAAVGLHG